MVVLILSPVHCKGCWRCHWQFWQFSLQLLQFFFFFFTFIFSSLCNKLFFLCQTFEPNGHIPMLPRTQDCLSLAMILFKNKFSKIQGLTQEQTFRATVPVKSLDIATDSYYVFSALKNNELWNYEITHMANKELCGKKISVKKTKCNL